VWVRFHFKLLPGCPDYCCRGEGRSGRTESKGLPIEGGSGLGYSTNYAIIVVVTPASSSEGPSRHRQKFQHSAPGAPQHFYRYPLNFFPISGDQEVKLEYTPSEPQGSPPTRNTIISPSDGSHLGYYKNQIEGGEGSTKRWGAKFSFLF